MSNSIYNKLEEKECFRALFFSLYIIVRMRKINLLIVGLIAAFIVSCNQSGKKTETDSRATVKHLMVLSQKDTIQVLDLTNQFMTAVKEQRYADAAMMLHEMKADDPFAQPELLDNEQLKSVLQRLKAFPIYDYTISDCIFKEAFDNEVRCKVVLFPKTDKEDMRPNATTWYFKPVRYLGEWKLCFRSSAQGDRTFHSSAQ